MLLEQTLIQSPPIPADFLTRQLPVNTPTVTTTDAQRWQAFASRDARYDGQFFMAVRTTGIYCRPTCPARKPKRENVQFFDTTEQARAAGFRACKRCHPDDANPQIELAKSVCIYIQDHLDDALTLDALGVQFHLSPHHLQRVFKRIVGVTPREYAEAYRINHVKNSLRDGDTIAGALYEAGYSSSSRLYERAPAHLGMTPATYQRGGAGMNIHYAIVDCALGRLLVASTERGVCAVYVSDPDADAHLVETLNVEYPAALIEAGASEMGESVSALVRHIDGQQPRLDLPIDVQATAFQRRVWAALQAIPYGETRTYSELAAELGEPNSARAVARACATNPVAILVPCHRVIGADGKLRGYRWGIERKRALLEREARAAGAKIIP